MRETELNIMKKMMPTSEPVNRIIFHACIALLAMVVLQEDCFAVQMSGAPSLSEIVLFGICSPNELRTGNEPKTSQECVRRYLGAIPQKSWLWGFKPPTSSEDAPTTRRRNIIEQITVIHGEATRKTADAFGSAMLLWGEWEGMSEGPLAEADYVEQWLKQRPGTAIEPFLHLFMAHRLRAGYEAAKACHEKGLWPILARRYNDSLRSAHASGNQLISCIADDLDAQPFVYLEGQGRP
jgi:hypothetical protein